MVVYNGLDTKVVTFIGIVLIVLFICFIIAIVNKFKNHPYVEKRYECKECNVVIKKNKNYKKLYCPYCGKEMIKSFWV